MYSVDVLSSYYEHSVFVKHANAILWKINDSDVRTAKCDGLYVIGHFYFTQAPQGLLLITRLIKVKVVY